MMTGYMRDNSLESIAKHAKGGHCRRVGCTAFMCDPFYLDLYLFLIFYEGRIFFLDLTCRSVRDVSLKVLSKSQPQTTQVGLNPVPPGLVW